MPRSFRSGFVLRGLLASRKGSGWSRACITAAAASVALVSLGLSAANAGLVYDTSLATPPGVYFGSGNINQHWTVNTNNGIELGFQALQRYTGPYTPLANSSTYIVNEGTFSPSSGRHGSFWDFAFSLNLGSSGNTLSGVTSQLCLNDAVTQTNGCFDPLLIPDNATNGNIGAQNAETLSFTGIRDALGDPNYNPWIADTYTFSWTLLDSSGTTLDAVGATFKTVPEPSTIALFGAGLLALGWLSFRRRRPRTAT